MRNIIGMAFLAFGLMTGNAYAAGTDACPKVIEIKSTPFTSSDPGIRPPFNEGFRYLANVNGQKWTGFTMGTRDSFLENKYKLKAESFNGSICTYGGETDIVKDEDGNIVERSIPYLKLERA
jgi:hypothetical protein